MRMFLFLYERNDERHEAMFAIEGIYDLAMMYD